MKNKLNKVIAALAGSAILIMGMAAPAFAQTLALGLHAAANVSGTVSTGIVNAEAGASVGVSARVAAAIKTAQQRADQEITRRINALNALGTRVNAMVKLSADEKTTLSSTIQTQITAMNTLQTQIATDAAADSTSSLKTDIQSITKSYRIFILVIPQGAIDAAGDRVLDVAGMFTSLSTQLQARITAAQAAGNSMTTSVAALADMNANIADANTQANAVVAGIASLQPDNGDATIQASNTAALKAARTKIQAGQADLVAARKDAGTIVKALLAIKITVAASSTTTMNTSTTTATTTASSTP